MQWRKNSKDERKEKLQAASAGRLPDSRERERERERECTSGMMMVPEAKTGSSRSRVMGGAPGS